MIIEPDERSVVSYSLPEWARESHDTAQLAAKLLYADLTALLLGLTKLERKH